MPAAWIPSTIAALEEAVRDGLLVESHYLDFKRELAPGAGGNKALAKDLASFAIDGGQIVVGVDEDQAGAPPTVRPVVLAGLKERVDQVARSAVTPPLHVRCVELPGETDPSYGCLVIIVPPSPSAPHQAAERLWGRGDTTNHVLSTGEIDGIYNNRARRLARVDVLLEEEIGRDPTPTDLRELGHLFVVAQPDTVDDELLFRALNQGDFSTWTHNELYPRLGRARWAPDLESVGTASRRATGWAIHDYCISEERVVRPNGEVPARESHLLDVEVREDGGVRLFCGHATDAVGGGTRFMDAVVCGLILRAVEVRAGHHRNNIVLGFMAFWGHADQHTGSGVIPGHPEYYVAPRRVLRGYLPPRNGRYVRGIEQ